MDKELYTDDLFGVPYHQCNVCDGTGETEDGDLCNECDGAGSL